MPPPSLPAGRTECKDRARRDCGAHQAGSLRASGCGRRKVVPEAREAMRVVLVDDVAEIRQLIREVLTKAGHEVVGQAADGSSAVQETLAERPDLVITDFRMPQTDG